jgi:hypothetical protein
VKRDWLQPIYFEVKENKEKYMEPQLLTVLYVQGAAAISEKYTHIRKNSTAQLIMIRFY